MGEHDGHSRVGIWTECQRTDTLLAEVPHLPMPTRCRIDHCEPRLTSTETHPQLSCFAPFHRRSLAWHSLLQKGVCNPETTIFQVHRRFRGSRRAYCRN